MNLKLDKSLLGKNFCDLDSLQTFNGFSFYEQVKEKNSIIEQYLTTQIGEEEILTAVTEAQLKIWKTMRIIAKPAYISFNVFKNMWEVK